MVKFNVILYEYEAKLNEPIRKHPIAGFNETQLALACQEMIKKSKMHKYPLGVESLNKVI